jgi:hypothetical protein
MYKNHINPENFNHKLVIIFLQNGKMASPMSLLFKMALYMKLHHGGSISCDHMVSPKGVSNETQRQVPFNIQAQNSSLL